MPAPRPSQSDDDTLDLELWHAFVAGDDPAFERLFRRHAAALCSFAFSSIGDRDVAEDVVHATFCALWSSRFRLAPPRSVRAYLFTAVRNRARNHERDERARRMVLHRLQADPTAIEKPASPEPDERIARIEAEVMRLPPRCREAVVLVRFHGMRQAEAAEVLGIAPKTLEIHLGRAMKLLRERLNSRAPETS